MKYQKTLLIFIFVICGLALAACGNQPITTDKVQPIMVEKIDGTDLNKLVLTERAAERLDIQTTTVSETTVEGSTFLVVPYSTIIYDLQGDVWLYVNPAPLTYHREKILVENIGGESVYLREGPPAGTLVVTTGVAELYGADTGVGK